MSEEEQLSALMEKYTKLQAKVEQQEEKLRVERISNVETLSQYKKEIRILQAELAKEPEFMPSKVELLEKEKIQLKKEIALLREHLEGGGQPICKTCEGSGEEIIAELQKRHRLGAKTGEDALNLDAANLIITQQAENEELEKIIAERASVGMEKMGFEKVPAKPEPTGFTDKTLKRIATKLCEICPVNEKGENPYFTSKVCFDKNYPNNQNCRALMELACVQNHINAQQAENERLKDIVAKGFNDAAETLLKQLKAKIKSLEDTLKESAKRFERMSESHYEIDYVLSKP